MPRPILIANENGDWWEYQLGQKLWVLDLNKIDQEAMEALENELDIPNEQIDETIMEQDKLHKEIWYFGKEMPIQIDNSVIDGLIDKINHLQAVIRELNFAKKGE
jgi:hypothetical protein